MKNLEQTAKDFFAKNPDTEKVYVTSDGFLFLNKNAADLHANTNPDKKLTVKTFENSGITEKKADDAPKLTAEERIEKIKAMTTVAEVEEALKGEKGKTVKAAGAERIAELTANNDTPDTSGEDAGGDDDNQKTDE